MRRTLGPWLSLLLLVAACGGGSSDVPTTTEQRPALESFAREFSLVCRQPADLIATLDPPSTPRGLAANARQIADAGAAAVVELRGMRSPVRQSEVDRLVEAIAAFSDSFAALADVAAAGDDNAVDRAVDVVAEQQAVVRRLSSELGIDCGLVDPDDPDGGSASTLDPVPASDPAATVDGYGANAQLDDLADECFAGDLERCDALYRGSPTGSGHERYAATCGARFGARLDGSCAAVGGTPGEPAEVIDGFGERPELDGLATACFDGDLLSCNELFFAAPVDSTYEAYGATCGGRSTRELVGFCPAVTAVAVR